jgi:S1-C subfamily serine protease
VEAVVETKKKDRTLVIAASFLAAVAMFAVGYGVGHATNDGRAPIVVGADSRVPLPPFMGDDGRTFPMPGQRGGGRNVPMPGGNGPMTQGQQGQAFLGISGVSAQAGGVLVNQVEPGSAAEASGLMPGDRIVSVNGMSIAGIGQLSNVIRSMQPGTAVTIGVDRGGQDLTLQATLGSLAG